MYLRSFWLHGERLQMWLNELKIALIEQNVEKISALMDDLPQLESQKDIDTALHLIKEATTLVESLKDKTQASMSQIKKNIQFLNSATADKTSKFDVSY